MENKNGLDGVGILLAEKWVDKDIYMIKISDRMIVIKWLVKELLFQLSQFIPQSVT